MVRFHPALGYWQRNDRDEAELIGRFPAMVALVTAADGMPVTVHRTYLTADGRKAPVTEPKKLMGYRATAWSAGPSGSPPRAGARRRRGHRDRASRCI